MRGGIVADAAWDTRRRGAVSSSRPERAYAIRLAAAERHRRSPSPVQRTNGDERLYGTNLASFTKGLPHNRRGDISAEAYEDFVRAITDPSDEALERIRLGQSMKLVNPRSAFSYVLEGPDPQQLVTVPPPTFASEASAVDMAELYWQALLRDVPFDDYANHPLAAAAARESEDWRRCRPAGR